MFPVLSLFILSPLWLRRWRLALIAVSSTLSSSLWQGRCSQQLCPWSLQLLVMLPFVCNDGNSWYVADGVSNFSLHYHSRQVNFWSLPSPHQEACRRARVKRHVSTPDPAIESVFQFAYLFFILGKNFQCHSFSLLEKFIIIELHYANFAREWYFTSRKVAIYPSCAFENHLLLCLPVNALVVVLHAEKISSWFGVVHPCLCFILLSIPGS